MLPELLCAAHPWPAPNGPHLTPVRYGKKIEFPLKAGTAIVQFFGAPYNNVDVLITPVP